MASKVDPVPPGFHSVVAHLCLRGASDAIAFYRRAFGAEELMRFPGPDGKSVMYAELKIGDSVVIVNDEMPMMQYWLSPAALKGTTVGLVMYVPDADALFNKAVAAGAAVSMPLMDMFWGDRYGKVRDPFGHEWVIATHKEDVSPEEMGRRAAAFFKQIGAGS